MYVCASVARKPEGGVGVRDHYEPPCGYWESNSRFFGVILIAEQSLAAYSCGSENCPKCRECYSF